MDLETLFFGFPVFEPGLSHMEIVERRYEFLKNTATDSVIELRAPKSNAESLKYRKEGNEFYSKDNLRQAFVCYGNSIAYAEPDTEFLAIAYANRSAVLFKMKLYKFCLENINLAKKSNYPQRFRNKLLIREQKCRELMATVQEDADFKIKLCYEAHPTVPFISRCLYRGKKGIRTKRYLAPSDLVAIEESFCSVMSEPDIRYMCWQCQKYCFTLLPCPNCCVAMFCSKKCEQKSFPIHKYECRAADILVQDNGFSFCIRMLLTALGLFESVAEFQRFCEDPDNQKVDIFQMNKRSFNLKEYFKLICGADTYPDDPNIPNEVFLYTSFAKYLLLSYTDLYKRFSTVGERKFLSERLLHFEKLFYMKQIDKITPTNGCRMYGLSKNLRHSCEPNVLRIEDSGKCYIIAIRPILPHVELFENYWYHPNRWMSIENWQKISTTLFKFSCYCKRCTLSKPREFYLRRHHGIPRARIEYEHSLISSYDLKYAIENYKRFSEFILQYRAHSSYGQVKMAQECLIKCLMILYCRIPDVLIK